MVSSSLIHWLFFFDAHLKVTLSIQNAKKVREEELARMPGLTAQESSKPEPRSAFSGDSMSNTFGSLKSQGHEWPGAIPQRKREKAVAVQEM